MIPVLNLILMLFLNENLLMKKQHNKSHPMSFGADIDGRTVAEIREMLSQYPDDAVVESYTDTIMGIDEPEEFEFFHIVWNKKDGSNG